MNSVPSVARNGDTPIPEIKSALKAPTNAPAASPASAATATGCPARTRETKAKLAKSIAVPTERSMPPDATAKVMATETMASSVKLLTRMLCRFAGVRNVGVATEKAANTATRARIKP